MNRPLRLVLCLMPLLFAPNLVSAQGEPEVPQFDSELELPRADSDNQAPLPGTPEISLSMPASPNDLLTGLFATRALAEICEITIDPAIAAAMDADIARHAASLNLAPSMAETAYADIRGTVAAREPDCAEGSQERAGVDEVVAIYQASAGQ